MKKILFAAIVISCFATTSGCYYDKEELLYPGCDTTNVRYSTTITQIINTHSCLVCHGGANPSAPFTLENYANVKAKVNDGRLFGALNHDPGFSAMPQGQQKLTDCELKQVKAWINMGAPNN